MGLRCVLCSFLLKCLLLWCGGSKLCASVWLGERQFQLKATRLPIIYSSFCFLLLAGGQLHDWWHSYRKEGGESGRAITSPIMTCAWHVLLNTAICNVCVRPRSCLSPYFAHILAILLWYCYSFCLAPSKARKIPPPTIIIFMQPVDRFVRWCCGWWRDLAILSNRNACCYSYYTIYNMAA